MAKKNQQSIEPNIADLGNNWLKKYKLPYKLEQEPLNGDTIITLPNDFRESWGQVFISAIQKLVIKDVVEYADRKIEATRQAIEG